MPKPQPTRPERAKPMVGWYHPGQLMQTGWEVLVSTLFGRHSDQRLLEAVINPSEDRAFDYTHHHVIKGRYEPIENDPSRPRNEIWVDYVADTGDGWDSTYSIAYALAKRRLDVKDPKGGSHTTERGAILIMGGDEVYPTASREEYRNRLILPYECAMKRSVGDHPHVYAIPGNHDWYDSLASFSRVFIGKEWFAGWFAPQDRSYFALKLPGHWWMIGIDTQLGSDIDGLQVRYFEKIADELMKDPDARVVICCPEPQWIYQEFYSTMNKETYNESNLAYLSNVIFKDRIRAFVAGDLHHYRHHKNAAGVHKITAGGGGAFLHPTHRPHAEELLGDVEPGQEDKSDPKRGPVYKKVAAYPDEEKSAQLAWRNLLFPWINHKFGGFAAVLYVLVSMALGFITGHAQCGGLGDHVKATGLRMIEHPGSGLVAVLLILFIRLFTDTHKRSYRIWAGTIHGLVHLSAIVFCGWIAMRFAWISLGPWAHPAFVYFTQVLVIVVCSWFMSGLIMGTYLLISLNRFGRHYDEAFSSLAIADYKNFLRFHVDTTGRLTIYPMKIERVPRRWRLVRTEEEEALLDQHAPVADRASRWEPVDRDVVVELIEDPISVDKDPM